MSITDNFNFVSITIGDVGAFHGFQYAVLKKSVILLWIAMRLQPSQADI